MTSVNRRIRSHHSDIQRHSQPPPIICPPPHPEDINGNLTHPVNLTPPSNQPINKTRVSLFCFNLIPKVFSPVKMHEEILAQMSEIPAHIQHHKGQHNSLNWHNIPHPQESVPTQHLSTKCTIVTSSHEFKSISQFNLHHQKQQGQQENENTTYTDLEIGPDPSKALNSLSAALRVHHHWKDHSNLRWLTTKGTGKIRDGKWWPYQ